MASSSSSGVGGRPSVYRRGTAVTHVTNEWERKRELVQNSLMYFRKLIDNKKKRTKLFLEFGLLIDQEDGRKRKREESGINLHRSILELMVLKNKWVNTTEQVGCVEGIEVGDEFHWRGEMVLVGLHYQYEKGIHYVRFPGDRTVATSIVESGRYPTHGTGDEITYRGEGKKTQTATKGNAALLNNQRYGRPVRYIKKIQLGDGNKHGYKFRYEGLHRITSHRIEEEPNGRFVFVFTLEKLDDLNQYATDFIRGDVTRGNRN